MGKATGRLEAYLWLYALKMIEKGYQEWNTVMTSAVTNAYFLFECVDFFFLASDTINILCLVYSNFWKNKKISEFVKRTFTRVFFFRSQKKSRHSDKKYPFITTLKIILRQLSHFFRQWLCFLAFLWRKTFGLLS